MSFLREGKAGRSWPCQEPSPKGTIEGFCFGQPGHLPCHIKGNNISILLHRVLGDRRGSRAGR